MTEILELLDQHKDILEDDSIREIIFKLLQKAYELGVQSEKDKQFWQEF